MLIETMESSLQNEPSSGVQQTLNSVIERHKLTGTEELPISISGNATFEQSDSDGTAISGPDIEATGKKAAVDCQNSAFWDSCHPMKSAVVLAVSFLLSIGDVLPGSGNFHSAYACHKYQVKLKPGVKLPNGTLWRRIGRIRNVEACPNTNCKEENWGQECFPGGCRCLRMMGSKPHLMLCVQLSGDSPPMGLELPPVTTDYPPPRKDPLAPQLPATEDPFYPSSSEEGPFVLPQIPSETPSLTMPSPSAGNTTVPTPPSSGTMPSSTTQQLPTNKSVYLAPYPNKLFYYLGAEDKNNSMYHQKR